MRFGEQSFEDGKDLTKITLGYGNPVDALSRVEYSEIGDVERKVEQTRQENTGGTTTETTATKTPVYIAPNYWVGSSAYNSTTATNTGLNDTGYAIPFDFLHNATFSAIGLIILDGTSPTAYNARIGIYSDVGGFPSALLGQTDIFNYGDGTVPNNTVRTVNFTSPLTLKTGRYWIVFRQTAGTLGATATARFRWRGTFPGYTPVTLAAVDGTSGGSNARDCSSWSISFSTAPSATTLPNELVPADMLYLATPAPDIWLKTA